MPNKINIDIVSDLKNHIQKSQSVIFADMKGLKSNEANELREKVRLQKGHIRIAKNTLIKKAFESLGINVDELSKDLKGPTAAIFAYEDSVAVVKTVVEFTEKHAMALPIVKAGWVEGEYASSEKVAILSKLPSREELIAKVLGRLNAPITGFVGVLNGTKNKLVYALAAIADKKEEV